MLKRIQPTLLGAVAALLLLVQSPGILAYCPQAADVSVVPATPSAHTPFQIRLISRLHIWASGSVQTSVQGNQIYITGTNGTGPGIPLPEYVATIQMTGLPAGGYALQIDITSVTGQTVQCPRLTVPLTIAGAPPEEARAAPALSLPMLAALLVLLLGGGPVAVRRQG